MLAILGDYVPDDVKPGAQAPMVQQAVVVSGTKDKERATQVLRGSSQASSMSMRSSKLLYNTKLGRARQRSRGRDHTARLQHGRFTGDDTEVATWRSETL